MKKAKPKIAIREDFSIGPESVLEHLRKLAKDGLIQVFSLVPNPPVQTEQGGKLYLEFSLMGCKLKSTSIIPDTYAQYLIRRMTNAKLYLATLKTQVNKENEIYHELDLERLVSWVDHTDIECFPGRIDFDRNTRSYDTLASSAIARIPAGKSDAMLQVWTRTIDGKTQKYIKIESPTGDNFFRNIYKLGKLKK